VALTGEPVAECDEPPHAATANVNESANVHVPSFRIALSMVDRVEVSLRTIDEKAWLKRKASLWVRDHAPRRTTPTTGTGEIGMLCGALFVAAVVFWASANLADRSLDPQ
jgi:hypothetical protein